MTLDKNGLNEKVMRYMYTREEERHEIGWISNRLSWLLICQSFLITAAIMSQSNNYE